LKEIESKTELKKIAEQIIWQKIRKRKRGKCEGVLRQQRCKENMINKRNWWWIMVGANYWEKSSEHCWNERMGWKKFHGPGMNRMGEGPPAKGKRRLKKEKFGLEGDPATSTKVHWTQVVHWHDLLG
jgi:hypothetical protein